MTLDGAPWFVAAEVADLLYGRTTGLSLVFARLDGHEQRVVGRSDVTTLPLFDGSKAQRLRLISESGLYKLVMKSKRKDAKDFQNWVAEVVLPASARTAAMSSARRRWRPASCPRTSWS